MHKISLIILFSILLYLPYNLVANTTKDSLISLLNEQIVATEQVDIRIQLAKNLQRNNIKLSQEYAQGAMDLAQQINYIDGIGNSLVLLAFAESTLGNKIKALEYTDQLIALAEKHNLKALLADAFHEKGRIYFFMGVNEESLKFYHQALEINQKLDKKEAAFAQLNNMYLVHNDLKDYDTALEYLNTCKTLAEELQNKRFIAISNGNIGYLHLNKKEYTKALPYVEKSIEMSELIRDSMSIAMVYNIMALLKNNLGEKTSALATAEHSLDIAKTVDYKDGIIYATHTKSDIYLSQGRYKLATKEALTALHLSDSLSTKRYLEGIIGTLIQSYKKNNQIDKAFEYQERLVALKETLYSIEKEKLIDQLEIRYITREKDTENKVLKLALERDHLLIAKQRYFTVFSLLFGLLFVMLSCLLYKALNRRKKYNSLLEHKIQERTIEIQEKNKALNNSYRELAEFTYMASHDLKQPILNIESFSNLCKQIAVKDSNKDLKLYTGFLLNNTEKLSTLVDNIITFASIKELEQTTQETIDLNELVNGLINENPQVIISKEHLPIINGYSSSLTLLFTNLIENAIKYNKEKTPVINISCQTLSSEYIISVQDNGIGIDKEHHDSIFKMFKRLHTWTEHKGTGMGLTLCRKIVALHKGEIWIDSTIGEGSIVKFSLSKSIKGVVGKSHS